MLRNITEGLSRAKYWYSFGDVILRHNLFDFASEPLHASTHRIVLKHELSNNCVSVYNSSGSETFRSPLVHHIKIWAKSDKNYCFEMTSFFLLSPRWTKTLVQWKLSWVTMKMVCNMFSCVVDLETNPLFQRIEVVYEYESHPQDFLSSLELKLSRWQKIFRVALIFIYHSIAWNNL